MFRQFCCSRAGIPWAHMVPSWPMAFQLFGPQSTKEICYTLWPSTYTHTPETEVSWNSTYPYYMLCTLIHSFLFNVFVFVFPKLLVKYTRGNGLLRLMFLDSQSWINQSCYFSSSSFLPYSICLAWFFPRSRAWGKDWNGTRVIYLEGDIRKQKWEEG